MHTIPFLRAVALGALLAAAAGSVAACASSPAAGGGGGAPTGGGALSTARHCSSVHAPDPLRPMPPRAPGAPTGDGETVRDAQVALRQICAMMARSAAAWNRGDLDAFVADYMPDEGTTYIGRRGVMRGPAAIRAAYAPRFAPGATRDSLSFENVEVDLLAPDLANTIAFYVLARGDSVVARGPTSLVMRRVQGRWRIVHDHSS